MRSARSGPSLAEARVNRILAPSFLDGPGSRMAIFLQGCDLACGHCHNPETWQPCRHCAQCVPGCPGQALTMAAGRVHHAPDRCLGCDRCLETCACHASPKVASLTVAQVLERVRPWVPFLDGITFSGGECTLQWEFLVACVPRLQAEFGLPVLLDTNGNMEAAVLEALLPLVEGFLFDLKALDDVSHRTLTGAGNARILRNLHHAAASGKVAEVRMVLLPGFTDDLATVRAAARLVMGLGPGVPLRLSPFRPLGVRGPWACVPALDDAVCQILRNGAAELLGARLRP